MTKEQAIQKLTETKCLSTDLLKPLGISFEKFLQLAQFNKQQQEDAIRNLIIKLNNEMNSDPNKIYILKK